VALPSGSWICWEIRAWQANLSVALALEYEQVAKTKCVQGEVTEQFIDDILDRLFFRCRRRPVFKTISSPPLPGHHVQHQGLCRRRAIRHCRRDAKGISYENRGARMTLNVTLPDSLYKKAMEVAERERISVERVVYSALAEQMNALERLEERAARSSEDRFRTALAKIPDVEPPEYDRLS
jgi:hypothetical protein